MTPQSTSIESARIEIERLTKPGVVGFYDHFEVTELVGFKAAPKGGNAPPPVNLFSLVSAEEGPMPATGGQLQWLTPRNRLKVSGVNGWLFALARYHVTGAELDAAFQHLSQTGQWRLSGNPLTVGPLHGRKACFAPPDATHALPWNRLLKNNFWNGSYLVELADAAKSSFPDFWARPAALQSLSKAVADYIPLGIASLPDRLGSVIVQLPVTVALANFRMDPNGQMQVDLVWHPKAAPRPLRASCQIAHDDLMLEFGSVTVQVQPATLAVGRSRHAHRGLVWDDQFGVVIAATSASQFIQTIALNLHVMGTSSTKTARTFQHPALNGPTSASVPIFEPSKPSMIGTAVVDDMTRWTDRRIYRDEAERLKAQRKFVAYGPHIGSKTREHHRALLDLRALMRDYGQNGSWLWDPFLDAKDVLETLFYNPHPHADLRALSACQTVQDGTSLKRKKSNKQWSKDQAKMIEAAKGNTLSLTLNFRARTDGRGWAFHDRFLIFPSSDGVPHAWSLGTSINSLGHQHHILMAVPDAQLVMDAFVELWNKLDGKQHEVWSI